MRLRTRLGVVLGLVAAVTLPFAPLVSAQQPSGQGLEISPPLIERSVDPGKSLTLEIQLRNITKSTLATSGSIEDFVAQGEEGQAKLLLDEDAEPSPFTLRPWVSSITRLTLGPGELKTTKVTIDVPKDASPGGHYGVIRFSGVPPELEGTGVSLSASIGTLVLLNVSGDVVKKASIEELYSTQNNEKKGFFEKGPVTLGIRIKNEGSVHIKPTGTLRVTDTFGREVEVLSINPLGGNILPASIRKFEQTMEKSTAFGRYTVKADVQYDGKALNQTVTFWVIPYKTIAIVLGVLLLLAVVLRKGIKKYNQHIISRAKAAKEDKSDKS